MNSKVVYASILMLALLIVLPVLSTVNATPTQNAGGHSALVADGSPAPPPVPPALLADGSPAPPPIPPMLVADGSPAPPPVPPVLLADGSPAPPPIPPMLVADGSPAPPPVPNPWLIPQSESIAA